MKDSYSNVSLVRICRLLGVTRQAFYQNSWQVEATTVEEQLILDQVRQLRRLHPVMGTRKLYCLMQPFLQEHQIKMGRDALFDLLAINKLLVRKRRRWVKTTQSGHWYKKYPNLLKSWYPTGCDQLWVADITYVPTGSGFLYLNLITDAYSHKIMGYCIAESLETAYTAKALQMALSQRESKNGSLVHHSDRGIQYCSHEYVTLLKRNKIKISMTESGDPLENPIAERVNGILKQEYLDHYKIHNLQDANELLKTIINRYNNQRPHQSINMLTPQTVHKNKISVNQRWGKTVANMYLVNQ